MKEIYCDSGQKGGVGQVVRIRVTDEHGNDLLSRGVLYNGHLVHEVDGFTNNLGELFALNKALMIALRLGVKKVYSDSEVVVKWWIHGKGKELKAKGKYYKEYTLYVKPNIEKFFAAGGEILLVSGDSNPADLGDHK